MKKILLKVEHLTKTYLKHTGLFKKPESFKALDDVTLHIQEQEIVGLVGQSGSGKSTFAKCSLKQLDFDEGTIELLGHNLKTLKGSLLKQVKQQAPMIFQDPYSSLNPKHQISTILKRPLSLVHSKDPLNEAKKLLVQVGLEEEALFKYPHQFSGGQQQRISIARALALKPKLLVCDEPTSALDLSIQAQILNLLSRMQQKHALAILMITHDLHVVEHFCDRVYVMLEGRVVEQGSVIDVFNHPKHPYTQELISKTSVLSKAF